MTSTMFSLFLIYVSIILACGNSQPKCCGFKEYIVENSGNFSCMKPIRTNKTQAETFTERDFLKKNVSGSCLEISSETKNVISLEVNNGIIKKQKDYGTLFFRKCCPLNYRYNRKTHGCIKDAGNFLKILEANSFVYISLKRCTIIRDEVFESIDEVKIENKQLLLLKKNITLMEGSYCFDTALDGKFVVRICEDKYEGMNICSKIRCIRKCCNDGKSIVKGQCMFTFRGIDLHFTKAIHAPDDPFAVITGFALKMNMQKSTSHFSLDKFGTFSMEDGSTYSVDNSSYCIEHVFKENETASNGFYFYTSSMVEEVKTFHSRWIKLVSCIFLFLTIVIYVILPTMRNLFGKILLNYCVSTLILFACLTSLQFLYEYYTPIICKIAGFISFLSCMWSFTWLHIMSIDIWYSFGTPSTMFGSFQRKEWKRLLRYSLYGWGFPIIWVLIIGILGATTIIPEEMRPYIGEEKCLLENSDTRPGNYSFIMYFTAPLLIQQIINIIIFVRTILYCLKIKIEIERMNDSEKKTALHASKDRLGLIIKLAVIMGITFLSETILTLCDFDKHGITAYISKIFEWINCSQGIFIFIIFICKKKVYHDVCVKLRIMKSRKISLTSNLSTNISLYAFEAEKSTK